MILIRMIQTLIKEHKSVQYHISNEIIVIYHNQIIYEQIITTINEFRFANFECVVMRKCTLNTS